MHYTSDQAIEILMRCGLPRRDAETALAAYQVHPEGADGCRVASILERST